MLLELQRRGHPLMRITYRLLPIARRQKGELIVVCAASCATSSAVVMDSGVVDVSFADSLKRDA